MNLFLEIRSISFFTEFLSNLQHYYIKVEHCLVTTDPFVCLRMTNKKRI